MEVIDMVDLTKLQKEIYQNKVDKGFNVTDVNKEEVKADKKLVQKYTQMLLKLDNPVKPDHASDALACAITHSHFSDFNLGVKI